MKEMKFPVDRKNISRRNFLNKAVAGATGIAFYRPFTDSGNSVRYQSNWAKDASKYRFHLIGQAHIDPVWLWPWHEGIAVVLSTFRSALDRMNENPDFTFTASSAQFYQWVAENDPGMLVEIKRRVDEGRWNIVGGWWVEPDMNIPCGESMVRQGLYGQLTFQRLLGHRSSVAFNPDSFGHTDTLPQIIHLQGMDNYVFMRPQPVEKNISDDLFWWEGPDGTRVLTYRIPVSYNDTGSVRTRIEKVMTMVMNKEVKTVMTYYGAGDHGGGATRENIASVIEIQGEKNAPDLIFSTPERYFKEMRNEKEIKFSIIKDDLQHHAVGCYTAESGIKKSNRAAETALVTAEKIAAVGSVVWYFRYPKEELTAAWQRVLFLQFHDSLAGTSVPEHSQTALEGFGLALDTAYQTIYKALQKLEWQIPAVDSESQYLIVFNPHVWETRSLIEYDFTWDRRNESLVKDDMGNPLFHQWTSGSTVTGNRNKLIIMTQLPAFGYRQICITAGTSSVNATMIAVTGNSMENEFIRFTISGEGTIGITDKPSGREIFKGGETGCRALIIDDPSDTWSHDVRSFRNVIGSFGNPEISITEQGPLRAIMRVKTSYGQSSLTIDWILCKGMHFIEAKVSLNWHEHLKMLKFSFPVNLDSPVVTYETPYGHIIRSANGDEDPGQRWIDVSGNIGSVTSGFTLINDAKYGYSAEANDIRISVTRSSVYAHHNPKKLDPNAENIWQDQGIQTFRMMLLPHTGTWQEAGIPRIAEEFSAPPLVIYQGIHKGNFPGSASFLKADPGNIIITAIKQSEDNGDLIIRCVETSRVPTFSQITLKFGECKWEGKFRPCEIKTLRLNSNTKKITEVNLLEE